MPRLGILGGGQLARMLAVAAARLGVTTTALDRDARACAGQLTQLLVGELDDVAILDELSHQSDVITLEFEDLPIASLSHLSQTRPVHPGPLALELTQDRHVEKSMVTALGIPVAAWCAVDDAASATAAAHRLAQAGHDGVVLKTRRSGYDGKGQARIAAPALAAAAFDRLGGRPCIIEARAPFSRELSMIATRSQDGAIVYWPLVHNDHRDGILTRSTAPAPSCPAALVDQAEALTRAILERLQYVGTLAVEMFDIEGTLWVNEIAPRVHNSGHWTLDGAVTDQFENHVRAVLGLPLGATATRGHSVMLNVLGSPPPLAELCAIPGVHVHLYGKEARAGRKVGHVTVVCEDPQEAASTARAVEDLLAAFQGE